MRPRSSGENRSCTSCATAACGVGAQQPPELLGAGPPGAPSVRRRERARRSGHDRAACARRERAVRVRGRGLLRLRRRACTPTVRMLGRDVARRRMASAPAGARPCAPRGSCRRGTRPPRLRARDAASCAGAVGDLACVAPGAGDRRARTGGADSRRPDPRRREAFPTTRRRRMEARARTAAAHLRRTCR